jgi:hypothetical protein
MVAMLSPVASHGAPGSTPGLPDGWIRAGNAPADFDMGTDQTIVHAGKASGYLKSKVAKPAGFGTLMQLCTGAQFLGKRVRLSAWIKSDSVAGWAGLWMRVDGPDAKMLAFDNMQSRPIKGTSGWTQNNIVLDVAPNAKDIAFGVLLDGTGAVWFDDISFEIVDHNVPTTGQGVGSEVASVPRNLDFEK